MTPIIHVLVLDCYYTNYMRGPMVTEWRSKVILVQSLHRELRENKGTESLLCRVRLVI